MLPNTSPGKTEMTIFGLEDFERGHSKLHDFYIGGKPIAIVEQYKYLGTLFHEKTGCAADLGIRRTKLQKATGFLRRSIVSLGAAKSVSLGFRLYDICVRPVATYASAVWGPDFSGVPPNNHVTGNALEKHHLEFSLSVLGVICVLLYRFGLSIENWVGFPSTIFGGVTSSSFGIKSPKLQATPFGKQFSLMPSLPPGVARGEPVFVLS